MHYAILVTPRAQRQYARLSAQIQRRISNGIDGLVHDPRPAGCEKLRGRDAMYRIRVGNYRIVYEVDDTIVRVIVILIGHRRDIYRDLEKL